MEETTGLRRLVVDISQSEDEMTNAKIVEVLENHHIEDVTLFLKVRAHTILAEEVRRILRTDRNRRLAFVETEDEPPTEYELMLEGMHNFVRSGERIWTTLGNMTKQDHVALAAEYDQRSYKNLFHARVHRLIAIRMGSDQKTRDVFTEAEIRDLFDEGEK